MTRSLRETELRSEKLKQNELSNPERTMHVNSVRRTPYRREKLVNTILTRCT